MPEICAMYQAIFSRLPIAEVDFTIEQDPAEAVRKIREAPYDVVLSDFRMQHADGIEVLKAAREANPESIRILITGYNEFPASVERLRTAHIDAYLHKPLPTQELRLLLEDILRGDTKTLIAHRDRARELEEFALRQEKTTRRDGDPTPPKTPPKV